MKVTAVSSLLRRIALSLLAMLSILPARAGGPLLVPIRVENDENSTLDDQMRPTQVRWPDELSPPRFFYRSVMFNSEEYLLLPGLSVAPRPSLVPTTGEMLRGIKAAIETWNNAKYSNFKFSTDLISTRYLPAFPLSNPPYYPQQVAIDGYNMISFMDDSAFPASDLVAAPIITYFNRDFDESDFTGTNYIGIPLSVIDSMVIGGEATGVMVDIDGDGNADTILPLTDYKAGDLFDFDIVVNPAITPDLRAWPKDKSDIDSADLSYLPGSYDVQSIITTELGFAAGLGLSNIQDAVMNPYYEPSSSPYPTDPYRRRKLSFDDEMNLGIIDGQFPAERGEIGGRVLEGALVDNDATNDADLDLYVVQQSIFLLVRPDQFANSDILNNGRTTDPAAASPDNFFSVPLLPDDNAGTYRAIAEVVNGNDMLLPVGPGDDIFFPFDTGETTEENTTGGNPDFGTNNAYITDTATLLEEGQFSADYKFKGLPATDNAGSSIKYALMLGKLALNPQDPLAPQAVTLSPINAIQQSFGAIDTIVPEFYGGTNSSISIGDGTATDENIIGDDRFENNYITVRLDQSGRFATAINGGPEFLSGFNNGPRSFINLETPQGTYSNREGVVGIVHEALAINDVQNSSAGSWYRADNFNIRQNIIVTDLGGLGGIPEGIQVTYTLTNTSDQPATFTLRQVLDTIQFGMENPVYTISGGAITNEVTLKGSKIPTEIHYQTSLYDPSFSSYITLRGRGTVTPSEVTIGRLTHLGSSISGTGDLIYGTGSTVGDSGVALVWKNIGLEASESRIISFIVGFFPPESTLDGYANLTVDVTTGAVVSGNDDPGQVVPIELAEGEIVDNADFITNTGTAATATEQVDSNVAAGNPLKFVSQSGAFPSTDYITMQGAVADLDNDGDLDIVTAGWGGGSDTVAGRLNRIFINEQKIEADGSVTYYFRDVTFGEDGIPGTIDDRIKGYEEGTDGKLVPVAAPDEPTIGVLIADFNNDGWPDLFFTNQGAPNRLYLNEGSTGFAAFFVDRSPEWVPGLLNQGAWDDPAGITLDFPYRATAGDIDGDGDMDIIISEMTPFPDLAGTCAWIDTSPDSPDRRADMTGDWFTGQLQCCERVLINQTRQPAYSTVATGNYFLDDTLGSDERFGTITSIKVSWVPPYDDEVLNSWEPSELDRMPPVFPELIQFNSNGVVNTRQASPQANGAVEPHLGSIEDHPGLDLLSVREFSYADAGGTSYPLTADYPDSTDTNAPDTIVIGATGGSSGSGHGTDYGLFRNVDIYSLVPTGLSIFGEKYQYLLPDGSPDGYFYCCNYGTDYGMSYLPGLNYTQYETVTNPDDGTSDVNTTGTVPTAGGLFAFYTYFDDTVTTPTERFVYDANPLLISIPDGYPGDSSGDSDTVPPHAYAWAGDLFDAANLGAASIFIATDNDSGDIDIMNNVGVSRDSGALGGISTQFYYDSSDPYFAPVVFGGATAIVSLEIPPTGEPYGCTAADFDNDGDIDIFVATTTEGGILNLNTFNALENPAASRVYLNDSFGNFTDRSDVIVGTPTEVSTSAVHGDFDNDGDQDIVVFNALAPNRLLLNRTYTRSPNTSSSTDPKMFHETNITMLPQLVSGALAPPFDMSPVPGVNVRWTVADLNSDNRPDLLLTAGGHFTQNGELDRFFLNSGEPKYGGLRCFKPYNSAVPAPFIANYVGLYGGAISGILDDPAFNTDTAVGDVDGDGDMDVLLVRQQRQTVQEQPVLLINQDTDLLNQNSLPDSDSLGDAYFDYAVAGLWPQITTPGVAVDGINLKCQNQRALFADFNNDGKVDIVIANSRSDSGAPNVLVMNEPVGDETYHFVDRTETNLPLGSDDIMGVRDCTNDMVVGDFDSDGHVDIIFANQSSDIAPIGFRYLENDGNGVFTDDDPTFTAADGQRRIPKFLDTVPRGIVAADFDGLGEVTEDKNHNGILDPGEDVGVLNDKGVLVGAGNGILDWTDKPTETEDLNGNGVLDSGEDVGIIGEDGELTGAGNGKIDTYDRNNDGIITAYRDGIWDGSLDIYISFGPTNIGDQFGEINHLLINDQTNQHPGWFKDETWTRFGTDLYNDPSAGVDVGDIDLDGDLDIVVAELVGGNTRLVKIWRNDTYKTSDGKIRQGLFTDISHEVPYAMANSLTGEASIIGDNLDSPTGWANDVKLLDVDGDGDLDMVIACIGSAKSLVSIGAFNVFYTNRLIGDDWNSKAVSHPLLASSPRVMSVSPRGATRGETRVVEVYGYNFQSGMTVSFGAGVTVTQIERVDELNAKVTVCIDAAADVGPRKVTVENPSGSATSTKAGMFNVYDSSLVDSPYYKNSVTAIDWTMLK